MGLLIILLILVAIIVLAMSLYTVKQQTSAVVQRFGKFARVASSGLNVKIPFIEYIAGRVNLRVQQIDVRVETKTHDNVFVHLTVSVQYFVEPIRVYEAFYSLENPQKQITSFVFDVVRARVPNINLDDVFQKKDEIANAVKQELEVVMGNFGYGIIKALVTDIEPDIKVKEAMNEINAALRMRVAATEKGEAEKIIKVKSAEAEAMSKALQGKGIADQRKAIIEGLRDSVDEFQKSVPGTTAQDVMQLILMTQYFDTLKDLGVNSNTILIPHSPGAIEDLASQIRSAMIVGNLVTKDTTHK